MCTGIIETANIWGSAKGTQGWLNLSHVHVSYDHPFHAPAEHTLNLDFVNEAADIGARVAVELNAESARAVTQALLKTVEGGEQVCTGIVEKAQIWGSGKGPQGWFSLRQSSVTYDSPSHAPSEFTVNVDFRNEAESGGARVAVELNPDSARALAQTIVKVLERAESEGALSGH